MDKIHVVCPKCQTVNAVLLQKINQNPICARCQAQLLPAEPIEINDANFDRFITRSSLPVLVDFWAPWCGPCRTMGPALAQAAASLRGQLVLAKIDTAANSQIPGRLGIQSIPSLLLFHQGHEVKRTAGAMSAAQIQAWATQHV